MVKRLVTGLVLAFLVSLALLFLQPKALQAIVCLLVMVGTSECARMLLPKDPSSSVILPTILSGVLAFVLLFMGNERLWLLGGMTFILLAVFLYYLFFHGPLEIVAAQITGTIFSIFYFGFLFSFLGWLASLPQGSQWLFLVLGGTFAADTGAYFAGRYFGKHLLAPKVSPKKTVEGWLGGIVVSFCVILFINYLFSKQFFISVSLGEAKGWGECLWVAFFTGGVGPLGDLSESLLKRSVGVKDSGNILPGHGGLLDRVDALLFATPLVYGYALYLQG